jgi:hypothetical protein
MITALIVSGSVGSYLAVALLVARVTYGRIYREEIGRHSILPSTLEWNVTEIKEKARYEARFEAGWMSVIWPLSVPLWLVLKSGFWACRRFVTDGVREPDSVRAWDQAHRIRDLEHEVAELKRATGDDYDEEEDRD